MVEFISDLGFIIVGLSAVSFLAGFIDSIAGGGGLLSMPALLLAGVPPQSALGTAKFASNLGTLVAAINFIRARTIVWKLIIHGILFSLIGAYIGARSALSISEETLAKVIIVLLPIALVFSFIPKKKLISDRNTWSKLSLYFTVPLTCLLLGFYDGFFGPGTGTLLILAFHLFFGVSLSAASGSAKIFNLTSNLGATIAFVLCGKCAFGFAIPMAMTNIAGNYFGSKLVIRKGDSVVRYVLLISVLILIISLIFKFLV